MKLKIVHSLCFFVVACCLSGCGTFQKDPGSKLTFAQMVELRSRLDKLTVGMSRDKAIEVIDIGSLNVRSYTHISSDSSVTYRIPEGHILQLAVEPGDYDGTLRWASFDGETWPKGYKPRAKSLAPPKS